ncbi:MAG: prenyltransferase [Pseudohongiella sp.]|nr:prenyltransferase [Pseudohongiella sp.]
MVVKQLLGVARVNFLSLTLVCIALAAVASWQAGHALRPLLVVLVLCLGLCAHISVNAFNEYFDFKSGLDLLTQRTPFSGGSGTLVAHPNASQQTLALAVVSLLMLAAGGIYLSYRMGWQALLIGIPGVLLIYSYTQYLNRWPLACLMAPGLGFGMLMTLGAYWVFSHELSTAAWVLSLIVTLLVSNLLLLNQFPDAEADRQVGRRHLPIVIGLQASAVLYMLLLSASYAILLTAVSMKVLPAHCLLALLTLPLLIDLLPGIYRFADQPSRLTRYLGLNVVLCHLYPLLLLIGLLWAGQPDP